MKHSYLSLLCLVSVLTGCGGGGSTSSTPSLPAQTPSVSVTSSSYKASESSKSAISVSSSSSKMSSKPAISVSSSSSKMSSKASSVSSEAMLDVKRLGSNEMLEGTTFDVVFYGMDASTVLDVSNKNDSCVFSSARSITAYRVFECQAPLLTGVKEDSFYLGITYSTGTAGGFYPYVTNQDYWRTINGEFYISGLTKYVFSQTFDQGAIVTLKMNSISGKSGDIESASYFNALKLEGVGAPVLCPYSGSGWGYQCPIVKAGRYSVTLLHDEGKRSVVNNGFSIYINEPNIEIGNPTDPNIPLDPTDPEIPVDPIDPVIPVDPEIPLDPVDPELPTDPVDSNIMCPNFTVLSGALTPNKSCDEFIGFTDGSSGNYSTGNFEYSESATSFSTLKVTVQKLSGNSDRPMELHFLGGAVGIRWRNGVGEYFLYESEGNWTGWKNTVALTYGAANEIKIVQAGKRIKFYLNDYYVDTFTLNVAPPTTGKVSMFLKGAPNSQDSMKFWNFSVTKNASVF